MELGTRVLVPVLALTLACALLAGSVQGADGRDRDLAAIDAFVEAEMDRHRIPGLALAIIEDDQIVHLGGYGSAGNGRPVTPQTPFHIGSISKSFTAMAVMQLVEQGEIELDAPVQNYLPWFRVADSGASETITVRHLLHQTSGLAEETYMADLKAGTTLEGAVRDLRQAEPVDAPGTSFHYFNQNYATLGMIVEAVSGQPYGDYVRTHLFDPLEMRDSAATVDGIGELDIAQGHGMLFGFPIARQQEAMAHTMPEGGIVSTAEDMAHFLIAQNNDGVYDGIRVLTAEGVAEMHGPDTPGEPPGTGYAMGWIVEKRGGTLTLRHGGSLENFRAFAWLLPEESYGFTVLINQNGFVPAMLAYSDIPEGIADLLTGEEPSRGLAMRTFYWGFSAVMALVVGLDLRWWLARLSGDWNLGGPRQTVGPRVRWLGVAGGILRAGGFYALPTLLLQSMGRGFTWELGFTMAPTVVIFIGWNVLMGALRSVARIWPVVRT